MINQELLHPYDKRCRSYILFISDAVRARDVLGPQTNNRVILIPRSTQWKLQEFLASKESSDIINLLVIGESLSTDDSKVCIEYWQSQCGTCNGGMVSWDACAILHFRRNRTYCTRIDCTLMDSDQMCPSSLHLGLKGNYQGRTSIYFPRNSKKVSLAIGSLSPQSISHHSWLKNFQRTELVTFELIGTDLKSEYCGWWAIDWIFRMKLSNQKQEMYSGKLYCYVSESDRDETIFNRIRLKLATLRPIGN